jgi:ATP-dependent helicase/nuclease subunit A
VSGAEKKRLADDDVRDEFRRELDVSFVIEAGAGTGKTTLIVDRILAHVLRGDSIESIVAITFTEKAATELKVRVRRALEARLPDSRGEEKLRVAEALRRIDVAPIRTIHSFAQSLIVERPVEARIDPGAVIAETSQVDRLRAEAFEAELEALRAEPEFEREVADLIASGVTLDDVQAICEVAMTARDLAIPEPELADASSLAPPLSEIARLVPRLRGLVESGLKASSDKLATKIEDFARDAERIRGLDARAASREWFDRGFIGEKPIGAKTKWKDAAARDAAWSELLAIERMIEEWRVRVRRHRAAVAWRFARRVAARFDRAKLEHGFLDFDDLLVRARDLLRDHPAVRRDFAKRFRTLIVDEFQDTDPLQAEIAFFLAEEDGGAATDWRQVRVGAGRLVVVGDPKQSIYGFRRADIQTYEEAKRRLSASGAKVRAIRVNFRSAPPILDFVNELFARLIAVDADHPDEQPPYVPLELPPDPPPPSPSVIVLEEPGSHEFPASKSDRLDREATALAAWLKRVVAGPEPRWVRDRDTDAPRPPRWSDVAILFKATSRQDAFEAALAAEDVPYRVAGGRRFFDRFEIKAAMALLRTLDDPSDEVALLAALRGPFFSISDRDLAEFVAKGGRFSELDSHALATDALREAIRRILELRARRHGRSIAGFVEDAFATVHAQSILLLHRDGEQRAANLDKLVSIARKLEADEALGFRGYVDEVARRVRDTEREADAEFLDEAEDAVTLVTMHSAKGLEWPIVCIVDVGPSGHVLDPRFVERTPSPRVEFAMGASANYRAESEGFSEVRAGARRRAMYERRRLLYVAMTRARDLLVLTRYHSPLPKNPDPEADGNRRPLVDEYRDDPFYSGAEERPYGSRVDASALPRAPERDEPLRVDLKLESPPGAATTTALAERARFAADARSAFAKAGAGRAVTSATAEKAKERFRLEARADDAPRARSRGPGGVEFGVFVHELFERLDFPSLRLPDEAVVRALAAAHGLDDAAIDLAARLARTFLESRLAAELRVSKRILVEAPFAFRDGDRLLEGAIDLIAEREDGGLWIVDWKTDDVSGADLDARFESYRPQADAYRRAVAAATGREPTRVVFHFLRRGESREA